MGSHGEPVTVESPRDIAADLVAGHDEADRLSLADAAYEAAIAEVPAAYQSPHVRNAARSAVRMALGFKELPTQEGEA